jgi:glycosyltransferase involved in cell wall biosynthesis
MPSASPRIAFVTPRYGPDIVGGAETLCRLVAENLAANGVQADVLTTCARDHFTWRNELPVGTNVENGVTVRRFAASGNRDLAQWHGLHARIQRREQVGYSEQLEWMGHSVWSEEMNEAARDTKHYDWVIGIPYLFGTAFWSVAQRPERSCLIPCLHDEPHAWTPVVRDMLLGVRGSLLNSPGEADLLERMAPEADWRVVGVGYDDRPIPSPQKISAFCAARKIEPGYLLYAGRREIAKNVPLLFSHYAAYRRQHPDAPPLALMGSGELPVPAAIADHVVELGYVPTADLATAFAAASVLVHPSHLESLGMVVLEAWLAGTPALVNARSVVLQRHCEESNGGLWFANEEEFCAALEIILCDDVLRAGLAKAGARYTLETFSWPAVRQRLLDALDDWA